MKSYLLSKALVAGAILIYLTLLYYGIRALNTSRRARIQSTASKARKVVLIMAVGCKNNTTGSEYFRFVISALNSARRNAPSLIPFVIYDGNLPDGLLKMPNVHFFRHILSFRTQLEKYNSYHDQFGAYYRLDIPVIMDTYIRPTINSTDVDLDYVLYTDTDVLFLKDINELSIPKPKVISIGPQLHKNRQGNSGVLYFNVTAYRSHFDNLIEFACLKKWKFNALDQGLILNYFRDRKLSTLLPNEFNWKGYWSRPSTSENEVVIAHFHAAKPGRCLDCYLQYRLHLDFCDCPPVYKSYFQKAQDNGFFYEVMLQEFNRFNVPI